MLFYLNYKLNLKKKDTNKKLYLKKNIKLCSILFSF